MVLNQNVRVFFLYVVHQLSEEGRAAYSCHVFEADFIGAIFHYLVYDSHVVFNRVDR